MFYKAWLKIMTPKNIMSGWKQTGLIPGNAEEVLAKVRRKALTSRPNTASSASTTASIHAFRKLRRQIRVVVQDIPPKQAHRVMEAFEKFSFSLAVAKHEVRAANNAASLEKSRRRRGKPMADEVFTAEYGNVKIYTLKKVVRMQEINTEKELQREEEERQEEIIRKNKVRIKEERDKLAIQRQQAVKDKKAK